MSNIVLYPMTDIAGGILALVVTAVFLRFWKPRKEWHFDRTPAEVKAAEVRAAAGLPSPLGGQGSGVRGNTPEGAAPPPPPPPPPPRGGGGENNPPPPPPRGRPVGRHA